MMYVCTRCGVSKPEEAFGKGGKNRQCLACRADIERQRREAQGEEIRARDRARYAANREKFAARAREQRIRHAARIKVQKDEWYLRDMAGDEDAVDYVRALKGDPCSYCGAPAAEVDHIEPTSLGGDRDWTNLTACCRSCNPSKGNKPFLLFLAYRNGCYEWRQAA